MKSLVSSDQPAAQVVALAAQAWPQGQGLSLAQARAFAQPLLVAQDLDSGENVLAHADGMAAILRDMGGDEGLQACAYLVYASEHLQRPQETLARAFGPDHARLAQSVTQLNALQRQARASDQAYGSAGARNQHENIRRMLLAFSRDLRVVLVRLASRLQTLRHHAQTRTPPGGTLAQETLQVFAPLANRLGIWQIKWELEDLAFRSLEPETYHQVAQWLEEKRTEREQYLHDLRVSLLAALAAQGIDADIQARPKHIYSIVKKMRGKSLNFDQVFDIRALRVVVPEVADCYQVLAHVHEQFTPIAEEFDDYIAKPKANGYQSLHTTLVNPLGTAVEFQIRTESMHAVAEEGIAALREEIGPHYDLSALWDKHCEYEFATRNVDDTMATMVAEPYVNHIPTMTGGVGYEDLYRFYKHHFVNSNPPDTSLIPISRTVGGVPERRLPSAIAWRIRSLRSWSCLVMPPLERLFGILSRPERSVRSVPARCIGHPIRGTGC